MNENSEPHNDPSEQPSSIEQQLKRFRPRAPKLDFTAITLASAQSGSVSIPTASLASNRTGFSAIQLATSIAASWLLGAIVGGGFIFYALNPNSTPVAKNNQLDRSDPASATEQPALVPPNKRTLPANDQPNQIAAETPSPTARSIADLSSPSLFDLDLDSPFFDSQLTARGQSRRSPPTGTGDRYVTTTSNRSKSEPFTPTMPSNSSQLMKGFLSDPIFRIQ